MRLDIKINRSTSKDTRVVDSWLLDFQSADREHVVTTYREDKPRAGMAKRALTAHLVGMIKGRKIHESVLTRVMKKFVVVYKADVEELEFSIFCQKPWIK